MNLNEMKSALRNDFNSYFTIRKECWKHDDLYGATRCKAKLDLIAEYYYTFFNDKELLDRMKVKYLPLKPKRES